MKKIFLSADELMLDAFQLAQQIYKSDFYPSLIIGILRGGAPISIAIHEYFSYRGFQSKYRSIYASSYTDIGVQNQTVTVEGLDSIIETIKPNDKVLIIDDVFDTGKSAEAVLAKINTGIKRKFPENEKLDLRVATVWFKSVNNLTDLEPDYFLHTTDKWLVFPHELVGLSESEIAEQKPGVSDTIASD